MKTILTATILCATATAMLWIFTLAPAHAATRCWVALTPCPPPPQEWKRMIEGDRSAEFTADYVAGKSICKGDETCIRDELKRRGWNSMGD